MSTWTVLDVKTSANMCAVPHQEMVSLGDIDGEQLLARYDTLIATMRGGRDILPIYSQNQFLRCLRLLLCMVISLVHHIHQAIV